MKKASLIIAILFVGLSAAFSQIGYEIYEKDQFGLPKKTGSYQPIDSGGYDIYHTDEFGLPQKQVSVQPKRTW
jgi:hypothetical protein